LFICKGKELTILFKWFLGITRTNNSPRLYQELPPPMDAFPTYNTKGAFAHGAIRGASGAKYVAS